MSRENEGQRAKLIAEAIGQAKDLLARAYNRAGSEIGLAIRPQLLLAFIDRLNQAQHAAGILARQGYAEDVWVIVRTMVDLAVNGAYLQIALEDELISFLAGDSVAWSRQLYQFETALGETLTDVGEERRETARADRASAEAATERKISPQKWSKLLIAAKITLLDEWSKSNSYELLYRNTYMTGSCFAHGNYVAVQHFHMLMMDQTTDFEFKGMADVNLAMSQVGKILRTFGMFLDKLTTLDAERDLEMIISKLEEANGLRTTVFKL